jgi:hypothetical protein
MTSGAPITNASENSFMVEMGQAFADLAESLGMAARDPERLATRIRDARPRTSHGADSLEVYGAAALVSGYCSHLRARLRADRS